MPPLELADLVIGVITPPETFYRAPSQEYKYDYLLRVARVHNLYNTESPGEAPQAM